MSSEKMYCGEVELGKTEFILYTVKVNDVDTGLWSARMKELVVSDKFKHMAVLIRDNKLEVGVCAEGINTMHMYKNFIFTKDLDSMLSAFNRICIAENRTHIYKTGIAVRLNNKSTLLLITSIKSKPNLNVLKSELKRLVLHASKGKSLGKSRIFNSMEIRKDKIEPVLDTGYIVFTDGDKIQLKPFDSVVLVKDTLETYQKEDKVFRPNVKILHKIRMLIFYKFTDFVEKFKSQEDIAADVTEHLKRYTTNGITFDKVLVIVNFLSGYIKDLESDTRKSSEDYERLKLAKEIIAHLEQVKITYIVKPDDYVQVKSPHERSGHWRYYASGKKVWVNSCRIHKEKEVV